MVVQLAPSTQALAEAGSPPWAHRMAMRLSQFFQPLRPVQPVRVWRVAAAADLPLATDWPGSLAFLDTGQLAVAVGSDWLEVTLGGPV